MNREPWGSEAIPPHLCRHATTPIQRHVPAERPAKRPTLSLDELGFRANLHCARRFDTDACGPKPSQLLGFVARPPRNVAFFKGCQCSQTPLLLLPVGDAAILRRGRHGLCADREAISEKRPTAVRAAGRAVGSCCYFQDLSQFRPKRENALFILHNPPRIPCIRDAVRDWRPRSFSIVLNMRLTSLGPQFSHHWLAVLVASDRVC
jgi:hypothetical protein